MWDFSDEIDQTSLKKMIQLVCRHNMEFKILSNITVDFSYFHGLVALVISYTIIMYQMLEGK